MCLFKQAAFLLVYLYNHQNRAAKILTRDALAEAAALRPLLESQDWAGEIWVWLKIKQEGHTATYQGKPFWYRFFEPQIFILPGDDLGVLY